MHGTTESSLDRLLASFREAAHDNRDLGDLFERMIANYLVTDPQYANLFSDVWLWGEWPDRWGADTGIDLVAREAATGGYWAIQCKFYLPEHQISKQDVDTFLSTSGKRFSTSNGDHAFSNRLIVSTTDRWNSTAEKTLENQTIPVERMTMGDLEQSPVDWSQFDLYQPATMQLADKKVLDTHQVEASNNVLAGFEQHDRGKLIMACGTGKTFTALRLMEELVPEGGRVLFLAPSISLVSQSLREWTADAETPFHPMVVCSDTKVGRDDEDTRVHDIPYPATTNPTKMAQASEVLHQHDAAQRTIVFSTYQSIQVVSDAQKQGLGEFDLIICDEAHRTTGLTRSGDADSEFVKVHQNAYIKGKKRLYMTATPRIFADASKEKAKEKDATLFSMDDEARFGPQFHRLGFGEAVRKGLLCDYRVLLVAVDESNMGNILNTYSASLGDEEEPPKAVDTRFVSKIFGAWKGLAKKDVSLVDEDGEEKAPEYDQRPMKRAIAFSSSIKNSKTLSDTFPDLIDLYRRETQQTDILSCAFQHVDGSMNALTRKQKLDWLKGESEGTCRILSNARCLSEGVDVPALDGVIFFDTRDSVVDIVQSVGRAMRKPRGDSDKQYGYIVLPVGIPRDKLTSYDQYINGDPQFKGIWKVIKALRAHDESLVDEAEFRNKVQVIDGGDGGDGDDGSGEQIDIDLPPLPISDISDAVYAAIPKKLGDTSYWHDWAKDVARIAENIIRRIQALLEQPEPRQAFDGFLDSLRQNLNPAVDEKQAVEMLAQHLVTRPVFEALFPQRDMQATNPVSQAMEAVTEHIDRHGVEAETSELEAFYESIRERAELAKSEKSRQELIRSLYDSFFASAFKEVAKDLGIVYTPVEIVDFILQSANDVLEDHFGRLLSDENVHLLDPFTGTGTFITRLLQNSGLIRDDDLTRKYTQELHANELVLLAYYVANVNIESAYQARLSADADEETAFPGSVLTDTFQMNEDRDWVDESLLAGNSERIDRQRDLPIEVIVGNPPYSVGQGATGYPRLDDKIRNTYAKYSQATLKNSLYDSYIRAIRWASDRIEKQGVVAFVTNGGWLDGNTTAGLRKCFSDEFSAAYIFDLRGNANTQGELRQKESGNVFSGGTRTPIAITLLVKTPDHTGSAEIHYHDIGDYLSTREKLDRIAGFGSYRDMTWQAIQPNKHHDWLNQRSEDFYTLKALHGEDRAIFSALRRWVWNSPPELGQDMASTTTGGMTWTAPRF
ncbi:restriction endonuclease [Halomonas sp. AOP35-4E-18]|uniref:restriction endonuclease n=1 Tax=Halomonas sp. AOP35-4E-18 TaxID=3457686 RepID=UPI0040333041